MQTPSSKSKYIGILDDRYLIEKFLDYGGTSNIYKVFDRVAGQIKIAKILNSSPCPEFQNEMEIFKILSDSPFVIKCFTFGEGPLSTQNNEIKKYIILECAKGSLLHYVTQTDISFSKETLQFISYLFIKGIQDIHKRGISHRDIKLENVLLVGDDYSLKFCDFGLSKSFFDENNKKIKFEYKCLIGSDFHYPPEILEKCNYDGEKADIFSAGISLFSLMAKRFLFKKATQKNKIYKLICNNKIQEFWNAVDYKGLLSSQFRDLFIKMVAYDPTQRPSIEEILNDPFFGELRNPNEDILNYYKAKMVSEFQKGNSNI